MLKLKYLYENYDLARLALRGWRHDAEGLDGLLARFRISNNAVYPFARDGALCFLRLTPAGERLEGNVAGELEFVEYLRGRGYPANEYLPSSGGEKVLRLSTPWGEYYASAFAGVGGEPIDSTGLTPQVMRAYGRALGQLHSLSQEYRPVNPRWSHAQVLEGLVRVLEEYRAPERIASAARDLGAELEALPRRQDNYGLIHYDFQYDNVFYDRQEDICRVIDFDDSMYHWFSMDVERALSALEEDREELGLEGARLREAQEDFIRGYRERHPYTAEGEAIRPLMRRFSALYSYAGLIRSVAERQEGEPDWMLQLRAKLDGAIERSAAAIAGDA